MSHELTENQVIEFAAAQLKDQGWTVKEQRKDRERGIDLLAEDGNKLKWYFEAKGSIGNNGKNKNRGFDSSALAILRCLKFYSDKKADRACVLVPDSARFSEVLNGDTCTQLAKVGVHVWFVSKDRIRKWPDMN